MPPQLIFISMLIIIVALYFLSKRFRKNEIINEKKEVEEFEAALKKETPRL